MDLLVPQEPPWLLGLRAEVDRAFVVTGRSTPGWPDPYPDGDAPDSAYSRCREPQRYQILHSRVAAWVEVLVAHGLVTVADLAPSDLTWDDRDRGDQRLHAVRRLDPVVPGAVSLVLATTLVDGAPFGLDVGVSDRAGPAAYVEPVPDCGCDHCDSGSADLLSVLDEWVMAVARGGVVHVEHDGATLTRTWEGWRGNGLGVADWLDDASTIPAAASVWRGLPWRVA